MYQATQSAEFSELDSSSEITVATNTINKAKEVTDEIIRKEKSLWRLVLYATIAGIILVMTNVYIPEFIKKDTSDWKFLSSCIVGLVGMIVFIIQKLYCRKKEDELALQASSACNAAKIIKDKAEVFQKEFEQFKKNNDTIKNTYESERKSLRENLIFLKKKNDSVDKAIDVLSDFLRNKVMLKISAEIKMTESGRISYHTELSPEQIYADIHLLCKYISEVSSNIIGVQIRCGVIIQEPRKNSRFVPIVVYNPSDPKYKSPHKFKKGSLFSEHLINMYKKECKSSIHKQFTTMFIPDVNEHIKQRKDPMFELQEGQDRYMKSLAGAVIYFRPPDDDTLILGAINIDCDVIGAITEERFKEFSCYLRIAYRLIAEKLIIINKDVNIYEALQKINNTAKNTRKNTTKRQEEKANHNHEKE